MPTSATIVQPARDQVSKAIDALPRAIECNINERAAVCRYGTCGCGLTVLAESQARRGQL